MVELRKHCTDTALWGDLTVSPHDAANGILVHGAVNSSGGPGASVRITQSRVACECPNELPESGFVADPVNRSRSGPYGRVGITKRAGITRGLALEVKS